MGQVLLKVNIKSLRLGAGPSLSLEIRSDFENKLLRRREVSAIVRGLSGKLTRQAAADTLATHLKADRNLVHVVTLQPRAGTPDLSGVFYVYKDEKDARRQLPKYLAARLLSKDERKKLREEAKKAKAPKAEGKKAK